MIAIQPNERRRRSYRNKKTTQVFHRFLSDLDFKRLHFISQIQAQLYQGNIGDFEGGKT